MDSTALVNCSVIADTGFFLALASSTDRYHEKAKKLAEQFSSNQVKIITTWPVMTETCHLLLARIGIFAQTLFLRSFANHAFDVFDIPEESFDTILSLTKKYQSLPMDLADASLVILADYLNHGFIASTDQRDFKTYRWKNKAPFKNILLND